MRSLCVRLHPIIVIVTAEPGRARKRRVVPVSPGLFIPCSCCLLHRDRFGSHVWKTAKALRLDVPVHLQQIADEVIE